MKRFTGFLLLCCSLSSSQAALTWYWGSVPSDANIANTISNSMDACIASFNTYANYSGSVRVTYNAGVPTAQAGYLGTIEFGGSRNYRTAMHEMAHWLGCGTYSGWAGFLAGKWSGYYGNVAITSYDGPGERIGCDSAHFWPYGWNYDSEGTATPERHVAVIGAFRRDMGLSDMTLGVAPGAYRLRNRQTVKLLDNGASGANGAAVLQKESSPSIGQQWIVTLIPGSGGYFWLRNVASGKNLEAANGATNGAPIFQSATNATWSQQWQIVATDNGFYKLINRDNGKCLDAGGQTDDGAGMQSWPSDTSLDQEWRFVHPSVVTLPAPGVVSQGQPATASSSEPGNDIWEGNDGCADSRWTASANTYPQWWRVDLGSVQPINKVAIDWFNSAGNPRAYRYLIETSLDDATYTTAVNRSGNSTQNTTTDHFAVTARYVRITVNSASSASAYAAFYECRVYNESAPMKLLSHNRPVRVSSYQGGNLPAGGNDGDTSYTRWVASSGAYPQWWRVDLGSVQPVNKAVINWLGGTARAYQYRIEASLNDTTYSTLVDKTANATTGITTDTFTALARYVRVAVTGVSPAGGWAGFYEANFYGATNSPVLTLTHTGGNALTVSWPASYLGSRLLAQTNALGTDWATVPDSTNLRQITLPVSPADGSVFYRLVYP